MKRILIATCISLLMLSVSATAMALTPILPVGGSTSPVPGLTPEANSFSRLASELVADTGVLGFSTSNFTGTVQQKVYLNSTGLLFVYDFSNTGPSVSAITRMTTTDFSGWTTWADAYVSGSNSDMPHWIDRNDAQTIGFQHSSAGDSGIGAGTSGAIEWIQTNAQWFGEGHVNFIDGNIARVNVYGPKIPEPATLSLLGLGLLGFVGKVARRKFKA